MKSAKPILEASPSALKSYFLASRPKTWIASLSPVLIGTSMAPVQDWYAFGLILLFALLIQIGTNYANDYFDFIKGTDNKERKGPKRATNEGWITPKAMLRATFIVFASALVVAAPLMLKTGLWSVVIAIACVFFGMLYTGGPKPLGYSGLGELLVFPFFGPIAVCGSYFLQTGTVTGSVFIASLAPGLLSCAILIANNLRDEESDRKAGKMTLVARFGRKFGAIEYALCLLMATLVPVVLGLSLFIPVLIAILAIKPMISAFVDKDLMTLLPKTAFLLILYTVLFCSAL